MPTFSTLNHALQFGTNTPTVSIYGTDISGYITYQMSGSFFHFVPSTKYFALRLIFDTPYASIPKSLTLTPANSFTEQMLASQLSIGFYVDGGIQPGDITSDIQLSYFDISGISTTDTILGAETLAWYYEVNTGISTGGGGGGSGTVTSLTISSPLTGGTITTSGSIGIPKATSSQDGYLTQGDWTLFNNKGSVTSIATNSTFTGGTITTTGTLGLNLNNANIWTASQSFTNHITVDGYTIDLSAGVTTNQIIQYNGTKFAAVTSGAVSQQIIVYWNFNTTWADVYSQISAIITAGGFPTVLLDTSFDQEIPAGTYSGSVINNTVFASYSDFEFVVGGISIDSGVTFTGSTITLTLNNVELNCSDGYLTDPGATVNLNLSGISQIFNNSATRALFPQCAGGITRLYRGDPNPNSLGNAFFGATLGAPLFDLNGATYYIYIMNSPGGLTGPLPGSNRGVIGGSGTVQIEGDGVSLYTIDSTNLTGSVTFAAGYPLPYNQDFVNVIPISNNTYSLGSSSAKWKDGYFSGKINLDGYNIDLSTNATLNQVLQYNGTSFVAGTVATLNTAQTFTKSQNVASFALTDGATINTDASQSNVFTLTVAGTGRTLANPTGLVAGGTYLWVIRQDSGGSKTITTYGALFKWPGGTAPTLTTSVNAVDMISAVYDGTQLNCVFQADFR